MTDKRDPRPYLADVVAWGEKLRTYVANVTLAAFLNDGEKQDAVLYCLPVIGETCGHALKRRPDLGDGAVGPDLKGAYRMRNVAAHGYDTVDAETVWRTATHDVPRLVAAVRGLLAE